MMRKEAEKKGSAFRGQGRKTTGRRGDTARGRRGQFDHDCTNSTRFRTEESKKASRTVTAMGGCRYPLRFVFFAAFCSRRTLQTLLTPSPHRFCGGAKVIAERFFYMRGPALFRRIGAGKSKCNRGAPGQKSKNQNALRHRETLPPQAGYNLIYGQLSTAITASAPERIGSACVNDR